MEIEFDQRKFKNVKVFNAIIPKILEWENTELSGKGLFKKMEKYAYIELKLTVNRTDSLVSTINWKEEIVPLDLSDTVISVLNFFISLVRVLKKEDFSFRVEMTDGGYHPIDSSESAFEMVTIYAILDCFGCSERTITNLDIERNEKYKEEYKSFQKYDKI
jgi:hypothetical protein